MALCRRARVSKTTETELRPEVSAENRRFILKVLQKHFVFGNLDDATWSCIWGKIIRTPEWCMAYPPQWPRSSGWAGNCGRPFWNAKSRSRWAHFRPKGSWRLYGSQPFFQHWPVHHQFCRGVSPNIRKTRPIKKNNSAALCIVHPQKTAQVGTSSKVASLRFAWTTGQCASCELSTASGSWPCSTACGLALASWLVETLDLIYPEIAWTMAKTHMSLSYEHLVKQMTSMILQPSSFAIVVDSLCLRHSFSPCVSNT